MDPLDAMDAARALERQLADARAAGYRDGLRAAAGMAAEWWAGGEELAAEILKEIEE